MAAKPTITYLLVSIVRDGYVPRVAPAVSGADTEDWDVNDDAAATAYLRITTGWTTDGHPSAPENTDVHAYSDEPSVVSQLRARHVGSTVRRGMQSLCVAK